MAEGRDSPMHPSWFTSECQLSFHLVYILSSLDQVSVPLSGSFWKSPDGISKPSTGLRPSMVRRHPSKHILLAPPIGRKLPLLTSKAKLNKGWNVDRLVKLSTSLTQHSSRPAQSHTHLRALYCRVLLRRIWKVFLCQSTSWSVGWLPG